MKLSTSSFIDETKYEIIGVSHGVSIRAFSFFRQFIGSFRGLFGGKASEFEEKYIESWDEAFNEMGRNARKMGADAIYGIDIDVSELSMGRSDGFVVIGASGTAVRERGKKRNNRNNKNKVNRPTNRNVEHRGQTGGKRKKTKQSKKKKEKKRVKRKVSSRTTKRSRRR
jgi:uncharacterized protein YbjQ (UPF0145 family)